MVEVNEQTYPLRCFDNLNSIKRLRVEFERADEVIFESGEVFFVKIIERNISFGVFIGNKHNFIVA